MADAYCSDCKRSTEVVFDHSAGDTVCSECGLVLEAHSIDETSEWRTFANESGDNDPVRVGGPSNPLLTDGGLSTVISKPNGASGDFLSSSLGRWQNRGSNPDRSLIQAFKTIATMSDRLGLVATIKDRANEIYKKVEDQKSIRGRNQDAILAACLYIACRQEDKPRTVKEICSVANGATKKEIGRAKEYIVKQMEIELGQSMEMGTIHAGDFLRRFCSHLGMTNQAVKAAQEAVQKSEELDIRRSPISVAAAVIYMITQLSEEKKLLRDISIATGVAEGTIRNSYKDLYPYAVRLIPTCITFQVQMPVFVLHFPFNCTPPKLQTSSATWQTILGIWRSTIHPISGVTLRRLSIKLPRDWGNRSGISSSYGDRRSPGDHLKGESFQMDAFCSDCKRNTEVVFDHSAGDTVCSECGLVLEAHSIDETSEWRTFANESGDNDPNRVGGPSNPLLTDGGLSTVISKPNGASGDFLSSSLGRWQNRGSNPDRTLMQAFKTIATILGLVATIKSVEDRYCFTDRANEIYKKVEDQKSIRGRNQDAILAACLYIACRQEDKPRTVKEICSVANGATKKEIGRAKECIVKQMESDPDLSVPFSVNPVHAVDFLRRFCSHLGMTNQAVKAAQEAVQKSEELDIRRSPISVAAAVIYMIT
ncbi:hypothetical protein C5167_036872 [Papaver somniferum]|uniref:TFIIB-type domain-containing protein n=1 Tax=Papaver somniferum TaxID=3469 RepID=A0A4Y7I8B2_PAPSO|nr:hypothetical protein C5167_036872 [Papaver somniferum]